MRGILDALAVGLLVGCGGVEEDVAPEAAQTEDADTVQGMIWVCESNYRLTYYSDATYTTPVGYVRCQCDARPYRSGMPTAYFLMDYEYACNGY